MNAVICILISSICLVTHASLLPLDEIPCQDKVLKSATRKQLTGRSVVGSPFSRRHMILGPEDKTQEPPCYAAGSCVHAACTTRANVGYAEYFTQDRGTGDRNVYFNVTNISKLEFCGGLAWLDYAELRYNEDFAYVSCMCGLKAAGGFATASALKAGRAGRIPIKASDQVPESYYLSSATPRGSDEYDAVWNVRPDPTVPLTKDEIKELIESTEPVNAVGDLCKYRIMGK